MMIKLADGCYVAADQIQGIKANYDSGCITVRMKDGVGHVIDADFRKSVGETVARLVDEVNKACSGVPA